MPLGWSATSRLRRKKREPILEFWSVRWEWCSRLPFLFWNLKNANLGVLASLVEQHVVDVLILAECPILPGRVLEALNARSADYFYADSGCPRIRLYTRFTDEFVLPVGRKEGGSRSRGPAPPYLGAYGPTSRGKSVARMDVEDFQKQYSELRQTPDDQTSYVIQFARELAAAEKTVRAQFAASWSVDLNMNRLRR